MFKGRELIMFQPDRKFIYNFLPQCRCGKLYQPFNMCIIITSSLSYPFWNYTTTDLMNPFSFKITPILCLEIAWENSTAVAKRAGMLAVYNLKVSLFSGTPSGLLLKKAWSHPYPYWCQRFVLTHSTKGKARENSHWLPWCLSFYPGGCKVPEKILIPGHSNSPPICPEAVIPILCCCFEGRDLIPMLWQQDS